MSTSSTKPLCLMCVINISTYPKFKHWDRNQAAQCILVSCNNFNDNQSSTVICYLARGCPKQVGQRFDDLHYSCVSMFCGPWIGKLIDIFFRGEELVSNCYLCLWVGCVVCLSPNAEEKLQVVSPLGLCPSLWLSGKSQTVLSMTSIG